MSTHLEGDVGQRAAVEQQGLSGQSGHALRSRSGGKPAPEGFGGVAPPVVAGTPHVRIVGTRHVGDRLCDRRKAHRRLGDSGVAVRAETLHGQRVAAARREKRARRRKQQAPLTGHNDIQRNIARRARKGDSGASHGGHVERRAETHCQPDVQWHVHSVVLWPEIDGGGRTGLIRAGCGSGEEF